MEWLDARCPRQARTFLASLGAEPALCPMGTALMRRVCAMWACACKLLLANGVSPTTNAVGRRTSTGNQEPQANNRTGASLSKREVPARFPAQRAAPAVSRPPTDGRPRPSHLWIRSMSTRTDRRAHIRVLLALIWAAARARLMDRARDGGWFAVHSHCGDLTFDMSGGPKGAKRPLERPLDGGVRLPRTADGKRTAVRGRPV